LDLHSSRPPGRSIFLRRARWIDRSYVPRPRAAKAVSDWEELMPRLVGFSRFADLPEEQISEQISRRILSGDQGMIVWWSIGAGVHVVTQMNRSRGCRRARWSSVLAANSGSAAQATSWSFPEAKPPT